MAINTRTRRRARRAVAVAVHLWTLPDVPPQRLVLPLGGDRGGRDARVPAEGGPGEVWRPIRAEGVTHLEGAPAVQREKAWAGRERRIH